MRKCLGIILLCVLAFSGSVFCAFGGGNDETLEAVSLPIIMYHSVFRKHTGTYAVSPSRLEEDFKYIKDNGYTPIFVQDLIDFKERGKPLPKKPIMLTFDDGSRSNYINAFPLIKKYEMKCVVSVVGAYTDSNYDSNGQLLEASKAYLNYGDIKEMFDSGLVEFQNHGYNMHSLGSRRGMQKKRGESTEVYKQILTRDLSKFQQEMKNKVGINCTAIAFPFGAYSKDTLAVVKEMGFKAAFTCTEGVNLITQKTDFFTLKRFNRPQSISSEKFFKKLQKLPK